MSCQVIKEIADLILETANMKDEIVALLDTVLVYLVEEIDDREWEPTIKDLKQKLKDHWDSDDSDLENELTDEELEVVEDEEGFLALN